MFGRSTILQFVHGRINKPHTYCRLYTVICRILVSSCSMSALLRFVYTKCVFLVLCVVVLVLFKIVVHSHSPSLTPYLPHPLYKLLTLLSLLTLFFPLNSSSYWIFMPVLTELLT